MGILPGNQPLAGNEVFDAGTMVRTASRDPGPVTLWGEPAALPRLRPTVDAVCADVIADFLGNAAPHDPKRVPPCNVFLRTVAERLNLGAMFPKGKLANDIVRSMQTGDLFCPLESTITSGKFAFLGNDAPAASALAERGFLVFAGKAEPGAHGHVVVVVPTPKGVHSEGWPYCYSGGLSEGSGSAVQHFVVASLEGKSAMPGEAGGRLRITKCWASHTPEQQTELRGKVIYAALRIPS